MNVEDFPGANFADRTDRAQRLVDYLLLKGRVRELEELLNELEKNPKLLKRHPQPITENSKSRLLIERTMIIALISLLLIIIIYIIFTQINDSSTTAEIQNTFNPTVPPSPTFTPKPTANSISEQQITISSPVNSLISTPSPPFSRSFADGYEPTPRAVNGYQYVFVPSGSLNVGNDSIQVTEFWIGTYEVTNSQFADFLNSQGNNCRSNQLCLDDNDVDVQIHFSSGQWNADEGLQDYPVIEVSWSGADDFCEFIGGRLPNSAEWLKAASWHPVNGQTATYPWGEYPPNNQLANYNSIYQGTLEVNRFSQGRSVVGAFNMSGNVWEFLAITSITSTNRSWRGGAWDSSISDIDTLSMRQSSLTTTEDNIGFRCALDN